MYRKFQTFHINLQLILAIRFIVKTFAESHDNFTKIWKVIFFAWLT
jgi:hypothetical protein